MIVGRRFVAIATIAALAAVSGCASKAARLQAATMPPLEQLRHDLVAIFSDPIIDHAHWSVAVDSIARGDSLFRQNAQRLQVPASNQKLLTAAVAAERLGWEFRYTNRIYAAGPIADGVLDGDLVVVSDGDPTINPRHPERWGVLDEWAKQLAARGLHLVGGQLVGDDNAFDEPGWGLGWSWDDIPFGYGARVGALQYNESQAELMIGPGIEAGARAIISVSPLGSGLTIDHGVTTAPAGSETRVIVDRIPGSTVLHVRGQIALDASPLTESAAVANPTLQYVNAFREALARHGIFVGGSAIDIDDLRLAPPMANTTLLLEDHSPPLSDIIDVTLKFSRNIYAETLLRSLALQGLPPALTLRPFENLRVVPSSVEGRQAQGHPEASRGVSESRDGGSRRIEGATAEAGLQVLRDTLLSWGVPNEGYLARDGSGLSRYDWITADTISALLVHLAKDARHADPFRRALAIPGDKGTLETRMVNTPLQTRVWAKTGSMSQVRALSGYLTTVGGEPLVFAILVNGVRLPGREIDAVMDHALARLVEFRR
ncbi:MAG: D-alanyl-D-alanine carboxypeptidase/D-alanyl-D-alanine endopeptidase [Vicinamibacterales bacterium]